MQEELRFPQLRGREVKAESRAVFAEAHGPLLPVYDSHTMLVGLLQHIFGSAQFRLCALGLACAGRSHVEGSSLLGRRGNLAVFGTANHAQSLAIAAELGSWSCGCPY